MVAEKEIRRSADLLSAASFVAYFAILLKALAFLFRVYGKENPLWNILADVALVFVVVTFGYAYLKTNHFKQKSLWYILFWILSLLAFIGCVL